MGVFDGDPLDASGRFFIGERLGIRLGRSADSLLEGRGLSGVSSSRSRGGSSVFFCGNDQPMREVMLGIFESSPSTSTVGDPEKWRSLILKDFVIVRGTESAGFHAVDVLAEPFGREEDLPAADPFACPFGCAGWSKSEEVLGLSFLFVSLCVLAMEGEMDDGDSMRVAPGDVFAVDAFHFGMGEFQLRSLKCRSRSF